VFNEYRSLSFSFIPCNAKKYERVSGTRIKKRVELLRLLKDVRKFDCVLFKSVSRFARDLKDDIM